jgi:hypothetical protein
MTDEEWYEMRLQFNQEVEKLGELYRKNQAAFWKYPSVGKCSERQRAYLEKTKEMNGRDPFG